MVLAEGVKNPLGHTQFLECVECSHISYPSVGMHFAHLFSCLAQVCL